MWQWLLTTRGFTAPVEAGGGWTSGLVYGYFLAGAITAFACIVVALILLSCGVTFRKTLVTPTLYLFGLLFLVGGVSRGLSALLLFWPAHHLGVCVHLATAVVAAPAALYLGLVMPRLIRALVFGQQTIQELEQLRRDRTWAAIKQEQDAGYNAKIIEIVERAEKTLRRMEG